MDVDAKEDSSTEENTSAAEDAGDTEGDNEKSDGAEGEDHEVTLDDEDEEEEEDKDQNRSTPFILSGPNIRTTVQRRNTKNSTGIPSMITESLCSGSI